MKSARASLTLLFGLFLLVGIACERKQGPTGRNSDVLTLAVGEESAEGYDPTLGWGSYGNPLFHSTLLKRDNDLKIVPDLATQWSLSKDRLTWHLEIRPGVRFSDGTPLTAQDVAYTFTSAAAAGGVLDLSNLSKAEALDNQVVELHLKAPDITFIQYLVTLGIVPAKLHGPGYARHPIGSGPYRMVRWDEGQQLIVEANPLYYGSKPAIHRLVFLFLAEDAALAAAKAGQVDVLGLPSSLAKQRIPGMELHIVKSVDNRGLMFPCVPDTGKKTPLGLPIGNDVTADVAIRRAVNLAINRQALVQGVLNGFGRPAFGVVDEMPWDNPAIRFKDSDITRAKALLQAAGWLSHGDGIREKKGRRATFTILYNAKDTLRQGLALAISDMLRPIGIEAIPQGENWDRIKREFCHSRVVLFGFGDHSPSEMYKLYHTPGVEPDYWNGGFYSNPVVDANLDQARGAASLEASIPYWQKAQWDGKTGFGPQGDAPWAWLVNLDHTYFVNANLDIGKSRMEPHGHGWPITSNIHEWKWKTR